MPMMTGFKANQPEKGVTAVVDRSSRRNQAALLRVMPAKAGIQQGLDQTLDSRLRGNDNAAARPLIFGP